MKLLLGLMLVMFSDTNASSVDLEEDAPNINQTPSSSTPQDDVKNRLAAKRAALENNRTKTRVLFDRAAKSAREAKKRDAEYEKAKAKLQAAQEAHKEAVKNLEEQTSINHNRAKRRLPKCSKIAN